mgnify:CR=1 FL=1
MVSWHFLRVWLSTPTKNSSKRWSNFWELLAKNCSAFAFETVKEDIKTQIRTQKRQMEQQNFMKSVADEFKLTNIADKIKDVK